MSIDGALARIAGTLPGEWSELAAIAGRSESTVRKWGDHDQPEQIPLPIAIRLDIAHERAGGTGRPLFETYALQLDVAREEAFASEIELAHRTCVVIRESSQAQEAMVLAALPSANERDRENAVRELEDVIREVTGAIALLRGPRAPPPDTS